MTYLCEKCRPWRTHPLNWDTASVSWHLGNTPIILLLATGTSDNGDAASFRYDFNKESHVTHKYNITRRSGWIRAQDTETDCFPQGPGTTTADTSPRWSLTAGGDAMCTVKMSSQQMSGSFHTWGHIRDVPASDRTTMPCRSLQQGFSTGTPLFLEKHLSTTLLGCTQLCNSTNILEGRAITFLPRLFVPWPAGDLYSLNDAKAGSQKYFKCKLKATLTPVFKLKGTQQKDASIQTPSVVTSLSKTNLSTPAGDQSTNVPAKCGLSGLLLDLSQISPSLNKYKGVLGRQSHFASRERQA